MTTLHTQGKLTLHNHGRITAGPFHEFTNGSAQEQFAMVTGLTRSENPTAEREANARRLVACWNACIDIPTEALESVQDFDTPVFQLLTQTWEERDAMRALLHRVTHDSNWLRMHPWLKADVAKALGMPETPMFPVEPEAATRIRADIARGSRQSNGKLPG